MGDEMILNSAHVFRQSRWLSLCLFVLAVPAYGQSDADINLKGAIDFHAHIGPDSQDRSIDADDLARLAKESGMRGLVIKNHWESTAALAYMVRKEVPGIEVFGGITQDLSVGGINIEAVKHMIAMKGGWGRVVWLPTFDAEYDEKSSNQTGPFVPVSKDGHLLPNVLELIDFIAQNHQVVLETGHISPQEGLMVVHEAHKRGVTHIVITHAMGERWTVPQMQEAAQDGAFIEFVYGATLGPTHTGVITDFANAIRAIGPKSCIMASDLGGAGEGRGKWMRPPRVERAPEAARVAAPLHPQGLLNFMVAMHKEGISVADVNLMTKTNPALALGLQP
jgi:hypothetical protein